MTGLIDGGWGYIYAAYIVTWVTFVGYALSLWLRQPDQPDPGESR